MISKVVVGIAATLAFFGIGLLAISMMKPSESVVEHSVVIDAPPEQIFSYVEDFRVWQKWSSFAEPERKLSFEGADRGKGAVLEWAGGDDAGRGRMTIVDSRPGEALEIELEFLEPIRSGHTMILTFEPVDGGTRVEWSIHTEISAPIKIFVPDGPMAEMIGDEPDTSLNRLAALVADE